MAKESPENLERQESAPRSLLRELTDLVARADWIEKESARRQSEPELPTLNKTSTPEELLNVLLWAPTSDLGYRAMSAERDNFRLQVREILAANVPFIPLAERAMSALDDVSTLGGVKSMLVNLRSALAPVSATKSETGSADAPTEPDAKALAAREDQPTAKRPKRRRLRITDPLARTKSFIRRYYSGDDYVSQQDLCGRMTSANKTARMDGRPSEYPMPHRCLFSREDDDWRRAYADPNKKPSLKVWLSRQKEVRSKTAVTV